MPEPDSLITTFTENARIAGATVSIIEPTTEALSDTLDELTNGFDEILCITPSSIPENLFSRFLKNPKVINSPDKIQLSESKIGITDVFAGIARTGSVCLELTNSFSNHTSLLSTTHIAVLEANKIVDKPRDIFKEGLALNNGTPRDFVIITGPSATADMGKLVRGAHGPEKLHIIILK